MDTDQIQRMEMRSFPEPKWMLDLNPRGLLSQQKVQDCGFGVGWGWRFTATREWVS